MSQKTLNLAVSYIDGSHWTGGTVYLKNVLIALKSLEQAERPTVRLFAAESDKAGAAALLPYLDSVLTQPSAGSSGLPQRLLRRIQGPDAQNRKTGRFLKDAGVDCIFGRESYGPDFDVSVLTWLYDFQHLHYPEMFAPGENTERSRLFTDAARDAARIVVSSRDALNDFVQFAPEWASKGRVLSFVAQVPPDIYDTDPGGICREYDLPERFFYLPNQFWKHKNHALVIEALAALKHKAPEVTVVCTGNTHDARHPGYFSGLLTEIAKHGLRDRMILLGLVPHAHTFQLMRQSLAVLQPSLFEGWSTTVEEAKSVGKRMLLSSLRVHREQDPPESVYFDPQNADALAEAMQELYTAWVPGASQHLEEKARTCLLPRTQEFGRTFAALMREAVS